MTIPSIDFYSDEVIRDPYPVYNQIREMGPVVYLPQNDLYTLPRHAEVSEVLRQPLRFVSSHGVTPIQKVNDILVGSTLNSDPPEPSHLNHSCRVRSERSSHCWIRLPMA